MLVNSVHNIHLKADGRGGLTIFTIFFYMFCNNVYSSMFLIQNYVLRALKYIRIPTIIIVTLILSTNIMIQIYECLMFVKKLFQE